MKTALIIILGILFLGAICQGRQVDSGIWTIQMPSPTQEATPEPTSTPNPTLTPTWTPKLPLPTATPQPPKPTPAPQRWAEIPMIGWSGTITYDAVAYGDENPQGQYGGFTWLDYKNPEGILMVSFHNPPHTKLMSIQTGMVMELHWFDKTYTLRFIDYQTVVWGEAISGIKSYFMFCDSSTPQGDTRVWEIEKE